MPFSFSVPDHNAHYDTVYLDHEREWRQVCAVDKASHIARLLKQSSHEVRNVLEVGCGTGDVLARLAELGIGDDFVGIDIVDPTMNNNYKRASESSRIPVVFCPYFTDLVSMFSRPEIRGNSAWSNRQDIYISMSIIHSSYSSLWRWKLRHFCTT